MISGASLVLNSSTTYVGEMLTLNGTGDGLIASNTAIVRLTDGEGDSNGNAAQNAGALLSQATTATWTGNISLTPGSEIAVLNSNATGTEGLTVLGQLGDAPGVHGDLIKGGAGNLILQANNSYTGATTIEFGTIILDGSGDLGQTSAINQFGPASLSPQWPTVTTAAIAANNNTALFIGTQSSGSLTLDNMDINIPDRVPDSAPIDSYGGTITFLGSNIPGASRPRR